MFSKLKIYIFSIAYCQFSNSNKFSASPSCGWMVVTSHQCEVQHFSTAAFRVKDSWRRLSMHLWFFNRSKAPVTNCYCLVVLFVEICNKISSLANSLKPLETAASRQNTGFISLQKRGSAAQCPTLLVCKGISPLCDVTMGVSPAFQCFKSTFSISLLLGIDGNGIICFFQHPF